jgi:hypothetical protein
MTIYDIDWDDGDGEWQDYVSSRKIGKPMGHNAPHYPNKAERVLLTQMMQKSGQTEEQVRSEKSNRIKLAAARKSMSQPKSWVGILRRLKLIKNRRRRVQAAQLGVQVWELPK